MRTEKFGVSGCALYVPEYRVRLQDWCGWTGNHWPKVEAVVGRSFRIRGPQENVYTMAANAVLRLIQQYDIDPRNVGYLGLGTESSADNAAGAVIVKGMLDRALVSLGMPKLPRSVEVPEFKHACLGGIYALKGAVRWLAHDGRGRQAIVVSADFAEYERGSSGEQTQGAGAVATLVESDPRLFEVDLLHAGAASAYRGADFRKPTARHLHPEYAAKNGRATEFPVFNGKYSTLCYVDQTLFAVEDMLAKRNLSAPQYFANIAATFLHRPYHRMPATALGLIYLAGMVGEPAYGEELQALCSKSDVALAAVRAELDGRPDLFSSFERLRHADDMYPALMKLLGAFRRSETYAREVTAKTQLGSDRMNDLGNVYTAALPAWLAAGMEQAAEEGLDLAGKELLAIGYGSGDAADAIPLIVAQGWRKAAQRIRFSAALADPIDLNREQYESLHGGCEGSEGLDFAPHNRFVIDRIGATYSADYQDVGIETYRYVA